MNNIFKEGELVPYSVVKESLTTALDSACLNRTEQQEYFEHQ